ncbi:unnamed protein product, partial [marine sediment metagenome]
MTTDTEEVTNRTIYVNAQTGNDITGDGDIGTPFATVNRAFKGVKNINNYTVTISLSADTFNISPGDFEILESTAGTGSLVIQGQTSNLDTLSTIAAGDSTFVYDITHDGAFANDSLRGLFII